MRRMPLMTVLLVCAALGIGPAASAQEAPRPTILNVTMDAAGDLLTVTGTGFGPAPIVTIDGQPAPVLPGSTDTQITVVTPAALLTTPGTYRLTVVDSVRQVGEVFVVASRAGLVPLVSLTKDATAGAPTRAGVAGATQSATGTSAGAAAVTPSGASGGPGVTSAIEDSGPPYRTALGFNALSANTTGSVNTAVGYEALLGNTSGGSNTALGYQALRTNIGGRENTATGTAALYNNASGSENTATGSAALFANVNGSFNTATGRYALSANTMGNYNTATGEFALAANTTGWYNAATGFNALLANTTGAYNAATGNSALAHNISGQENTAIGDNALFQNTTGTDNTALGSYAGFYATTGRSNIYLGAKVWGFSDDTNTIRIGRQYGDQPPSGQNRTFIAGIRDTGVTDTKPVVIGINGQLGTANGLTFAENGNVGIGLLAPPTALTLLQDAQISWANAAGTNQRVTLYGSSGNYWTVNVLGVEKMRVTPMGTGFGQANPASVVSLPQDEALSWANPGGFARVALYGTSANAFAVHVLGTERLTLDGMTGFLGLGTSAPTQPLQMASGAYVSEDGVWTNASSRTLKDQIADLPASRALEAFARLRPVTFVYKANPAEAHVGFIAEDVPELVATRDRRSLAAMDIVAVLTKVAQEQQATIADLQARLARLEARLTDAGAVDRE